MEHPLTHKRLKELFSYDPDTGLFTRLIALAKKSYVGEIAGCQEKDGYVTLRVNYKLYKAHRLAWFYMTGEWPTHHIDHKDGVKNNNKFCNLRGASILQNQQNQDKPHKDSKSGFLGVSKNGDNWLARISVNYEVKCLGIFPTPELASEAYIAAKRELHPFGML